MAETQVDLVLVTYESRHFLPVFFQSLWGFTKTPFRLLVIDNNSKDQTKDYLQAMRKDPFFGAQMRLVFNPANLGVAKAWNQAVRMTSGRYLVFLNPDLMFTKDWLSKLMKYAARHKKAMVVGAKILNPDGTIYHAGATGKIQGKGEMDRPGLYDREKKVRWIQGSCFLVKREIFSIIGGFDEQFFMYGEEVDFCWRVRKAGYEVLYAPVPIYHYRQGSKISRAARHQLRRHSAQLLRAKWQKK
ncbi:MAG: glycosyltransferase family 2 protein [Firmicutes bacterium]|nr:glycosyltransferase family 2 protein [Bacillota bacterium]